MSDRFKTAIVRLLTTEQGVIGTGFFVGNRYILTCAHVVNDALRIADTTDEMPTAIVRLDFPFVAKDEHLTAKVIAWYPVANENISDIAILELLDAIPNNCQSILTLKSHELGHSFQAYGFPRGYDNRSIFTQGIIKAELVDGIVQIQECKIEQGFSGGPVWDEQEQAVVGMIVEVDTQDSSLAFFIPTDILRQAWPQLEKYYRRSQPKASFKPKTSKPKLLPYLPDRKKQEKKLDEIIDTHVNKREPLLCLIHGNEHESYDTFIQRLEQYYLPKKLKLNNIPKVYLIDYKDILYSLKYTLGEDAGKEINKINDLSTAIATLNIPVIFYDKVGTEDYLNDSNIIHNFVNFWADWQTVSNQKHLILICLFFEYQEKTTPNLWKRLFFKKANNHTIRQEFNGLEKLNFQTKFGINGIVLPELCSVQKREVEFWAREYLRDFCDVLIPQIREIFKNYPEITMEDLAPQLKKIIKEYCNA